jgi:hypothetical protein
MHFLGGVLLLLSCLVFWGPLHVLPELPYFVKQSSQSYKEGLKMYDYFEFNAAEDFLNRR